jgi:hypothetical protein
MKWLKIENTPDGARVYIFGRRIHHLEAGLILVAAGWILILHDWIIERRKLAEDASK